MKRFLHIIAVIIVAAAGCSKPTVDEPQAGLSLVEGQETTFDIDAKGEIIPINFKSNLDWHSEITTDSKDEWIKFIPSSGRGGEINGKAQVLKNKSDKSRTGTLTIISEDKTLNFSFCQKAGKSENNEGGDDTGNDGGDDGDGTGDNTGNGDDTDGDGDDNGDGDDGSGDGDDTGDNTGDQIPDDEMPDIPADETVSSISSLLTGGVGKTFPDNTFIMGYVISNTNLGNLTSKKNMYIQDETAGVMIRFTADHTYNYGDLLKIDVSGKSLENYNDAIQLNNVSHDKVTVESTGHTIPYKTVSMSDFLANRYESQYVALKNVQVCDSDMNKTWLENAAHTSINFEDGNGNTFVVFSSKYATYGAEKVPSGSGTLKGIASINNGKIQLIFSTPNDWADMTGNRLGEESGDDSGSSDTQTGGNTKGYLVNYEIPYCELGNISGDYSSRVSETNGGSAYAYIYDTNSSRQRIVTHTFDNGGKDHRNYTFLYDYDKRCPIWLAYHLNNGFCSTSGNRSEAWKYDPAIPTECQPNLSSSYSSGGDPYNRGHMLASSSRAGISNANTQTFYYTNMTPQLSKSFNVGGGLWNNLEDAEAGFTPSAGSRDTLYVVTGCLFDSQITYMTCAKDGMKCAVPDDFYKCFMLCSFDANGKMTSAKGIGYLFPHEDPKGSYSPYNKSIDEIEALAGFDFFCNVPENLQKSAEANKTALF